MSSRRGGRGGRDGRELPREVMVSKKISWLLRHGVEQEGLKLGDGGYVNAADVVGIELKDGSLPQAFLTLLTSFFQCYSKTCFLFFLSLLVMFYQCRCM
jgi:RNA 2'-phosphotransferase, Tpt1 / KptA family